MTADAVEFVLLAAAAARVVRVVGALFILLAQAIEVRIK
jgi:hypothetical protein